MSQKYGHISIFYNKKTGELTKVFFVSLRSVSSAIFFTISVKLNLSFNRLTSVNLLCSIYFTKDAKEKLHQIYLKTVKLPYLTENNILNNFDFHG